VNVLAADAGALWRVQRFVKSTDARLSDGVRSGQSCRGRNNGELRAKGLFSVILQLMTKHAEESFGPIGRDLGTNYLGQSALRLPHRWRAVNAICSFIKGDSISLLQVRLPDGLRAEVLCLGTLTHCSTALSSTLADGCTIFSGDSLSTATPPCVPKALLLLRTAGQDRRRYSKSPLWAADCQCLGVPMA
jgi:hypothetical protein